MKKYFISNSGVSFGYACINTHLMSFPKNQRIMTNRSMIRKTFDEKGIKYASELALQNCKDLVKIIKWNEDNGFKFYRMSSEIFPWSSEYKIEDLPDFEQILENLVFAGSLSRKFSQRLSFHPGPFNKLVSSNEKILNNTIKDLETHGKIFDLMGMDKSAYNKINIHVGAAYDNKEEALKVFNSNLDKLSDSVRSRLTVENDDKESLYSVKELYDGVFKESGIPIVFDYHHHRFCSGNLSEEDALSLSLSTWKDIKPVVHYSESRCDEYKDKSKPQAHSDFIYNKINTYEKSFDCMVEAKMKESAVQKYFKEHEV
jgi:UV DNA damage endonuclease